MKIELFQKIVLTKDISEEDLQAGDILTVVEEFPATEESKGEEGFALEAFNVLGESKAVVFVTKSFVRSLESDEMYHIRKIAPA